MGPQKHISISRKWDIPTLLGFTIRGFIWDIPILIVAYVLFWGPSLGLEVAGFGFEADGSGIRVSGVSGGAFRVKS